MDVARLAAGCATEAAKPGARLRCGRRSAVSADLSACPPAETTGAVAVRDGLSVAGRRVGAAVDPVAGPVPNEESAAGIPSEAAGFAGVFPAADEAYPLRLGLVAVEGLAAGAESSAAGSAECIADVSAESDTPESAQAIPAVPMANAAPIPRAAARPRTWPMQAARRPQDDDRGSNWNWFFVA